MLRLVILLMSIDLFPYEDILSLFMFLLDGLCQCQFICILKGRHQDDPYSTTLSNVELVQVDVFHDCLGIQWSCHAKYGE